MTPCGPGPGSALAAPRSARHAVPLLGFQAPSWGRLHLPAAESHRLPEQAGGPEAWASPGLVCPVSIASAGSRGADRHLGVEWSLGDVGSAVDVPIVHDGLCCLGRWRRWERAQGRRFGGRTLHLAGPRLLVSGAGGPHGLCSVPRS